MILIGGLITYDPIFRQRQWRRLRLRLRLRQQQQWEQIRSKNLTIACASMQDTEMAEAKDNSEVVLRLFHIARRQTQIANKLYEKYQQVKRELNDISKVLVLYSKLKVGDIIMQATSSLYIVERIGLNNPSINDWYPTFTYECRIIIGIKDDEYKLGGYLTINHEVMKTYVVLSRDRLKAELKKLPCKRSRKHTITT